MYILKNKQGYYYLNGKLITNDKLGALSFRTRRKAKSFMRAKRLSLDIEKVNKRISIESGVL